MRKLKNERNLKKLTSSLDEFYLSWLPDQHILKEKIKNMSQKEINNLINKSKQTVEMVYYKLRVEEKYKYYINLYILYETCCQYFPIPNMLKKYISQKENIEENRLTGLTLNLKSEPAFNEKTITKATDAGYWLWCAIRKILENYIAKVKPDRVNSLTQEIEDYYQETDFISNFSFLLKDKRIKSDIYLIDLIYSRINYAKDNIELIYSLDNKHKDDDEKLKKLIKTSLTRMENTLNYIVKDI